MRLDVASIVAPSKFVAVGDDGVAANDIEVELEAVGSIVAGVGDVIADTVVLEMSFVRVVGSVFDGIMISSIVVLTLYVLLNQIRQRYCR